VFNIILFEPEIPPNTGNIIRLCANAGARLHLIEPLGFQLSDRELKRAGLDYHEYTRLEVHANLPACLNALNAPTLYAFSTRGRNSLEAARFAENDALLFGPESRGLPASILAGLPQTHVLRIPMTAASRSLNLSNAVAIALYSAWSQLGYAGAIK
jgi:tRNA (cytidine/uridine-2'-O-)-methyltransferase